MKAILHNQWGKATWKEAVMQDAVVLSTQSVSSDWVGFVGRKRKMGYWDSHWGGRGGGSSSRPRWGSCLVTSGAGQILRLCGDEGFRGGNRKRKIPAASEKTRKANTTLCLCQINCQLKFTPFQLFTNQPISLWSKP